MSQATQAYFIISVIFLFGVVFGIFLTYLSLKPLKNFILGVRFKLILFLAGNAGVVLNCRFSKEKGVQAGYPSLIRNVVVSGTDMAFTYSVDDSQTRMSNSS